MTTEIVDKMVGVGHHASLGFENLGELTQRSCGKCVPPAPNHDGVNPGGWPSPGRSRDQISAGKWLQCGPFPLRTREIRARHGQASVTEPMSFLGFPRFLIA